MEKGNERVVEESSAEEEEEDEREKAKQALTGRKVTLGMMMRDGIIESGKALLSINYLGQRFEADLLESGNIKWQGCEEVFTTPGAWALHCKRLVNPIQRSGCGWAKIRYKGKKLDMWKCQWTRKQRNTLMKTQHAADHSTTSSSSLLSVNSNHPTTSSSSKHSSRTNTSILSPNKMSDDSLNDADVSFPSSSSESMVELIQSLINPSSKLSFSSPSSSFNQDKLLSSLSSKLDLDSSLQFNLSHDSFNNDSSNFDFSRSGKDLTTRERKRISYSDLKGNWPNVQVDTLVKCESFERHGSLQPFTVLVSTNAMLLMDFHCHLTRSEVVGYLGGHWDPVKQIVSVEQSFPVLCRLSDKVHGPAVEAEIRRRMTNRQMVLVGWYHSHPYCGPQPTVKDLETQLSHQLQMKSFGASYHPCLGFIQAPFSKQEERHQAFWVMPNLEQPNSIAVPMNISYSLRRDLSLTEDILIDMKLMCEFYSGAADRVRFQDRWKDDVTFMEKIRSCLASKLPEDQLNSGTFLDYLQQLLREMK